MSEIESQSRLIDYNQRYHYIPSNTKVVLSSTPESVSYNTASGSGLSETTLTFNLEPEGNFLDRAVVFKIPKIPLRFTRTTAINTGEGAGVGKSITQFFGNYEAICMKQFGILNAIDTCKIDIDGKLPIISTNLGRNLNILAMFYDKNEIHRLFQNSAPDLYAKYSDYNTLTAMNILPGTGSSSGDVVSMRKPVYATGSIFTDMSDSYNSRIPIFSTTSTLDATSTTADVILHDQKCLLPMNIFGIPQDETPLYNAKKIKVTLTLHGDWWRRIFAIRETGTAPTLTAFSDIAFRRDKIAEFLPHLSYTVRTGPRDSSEKAQRPFAVELAKVESSSNLVEYTVDGYSNKDVTPIKFEISCIPKRTYVFVKAIHADADAADILKEAKTADLYGRINSLKIKIGNKETTIATAEASVLYDLAVRHGLNRSFEQAMYFNGFVVPIDYSETVSMEPGTLVGTPGSKNGGSANLWISLNFTNLSSAKTVYQVGALHTYQTMLESRDNTWYLRSSFESSYDDDSSIQDLEEQLMRRYNYIGGRDGGGIGAIFSSFLPKIGNGIKNLVTAAFTDPNFRKTIASAWNGPRAPLQSAQNGGASFDGHSPIGGFYQHSNNYNQVGGKPVSQWSSM